MKLQKEVVAPSSVMELELLLERAHIIRELNLGVKLLVTLFIVTTSRVINFHHNHVKLYLV